jgi:hypothetical protein
MTRTDLFAVLAILAIVLATVADVLAWQARRYAARALTSAHTHPRRTDPPAPRHLAVDRRLDDRGPPAGQPDRRRHRAPDDVRATRSGSTALREGTRPSSYVVVDSPLTERQANELRERYSGEPTAHLEQQDAPTRDMRAVDPRERPR